MAYVAEDLGDEVEGKDRVVKGSRLAVRPVLDGPGPLRPGLGTVKVPVPVQDGDPGIGFGLGGWGGSHEGDSEVIGVREVGRRGGRPVR